MKTFFLNFITITLLSITLNSCVSLFSSSEQDVKIITSNPKTKVYYKDSLMGIGSEVIVTLPRDKNPQQFKFELDSHKTYYKAIVPTKTSINYYLNIPFYISYIPLFDNIRSNKSMYYDNYYQIKENFYKNPTWDLDKKRVHLNNISIKILKDSNTINLFDYENYINNDEKKSIKQLDTINSNFTKYDKYINDNILKKGNFIDTTNSIFMENVNTIVIDANIYRIVNNIIENKSFISNIKGFLVTELGISWNVKDIFGDTLLTKNIHKKSGEFIIPYDKETNIIEQAFEDAIHNSFLELLNDEKFNEYYKKEIIKKETFEKITLDKGYTHPTNIDEAMEASFTIKMKEGHGSGFLVSKDGYLITNHHVINKGKELKAVDHTGKEYDIKVIRSNKNLDLALCKIEGDFKFAFNIPNEKNFTTGSDIFAVGTPKSLELGQSVTKGVISGYRTNPYNDSKIIQTDAKINRGNSGGAVITNDGKLIGVVDYKIFGFGVEGLSFAIGATEIHNGLGIE